MDVVALGPQRTSSLLWQPRRGTFALTVVCKATFDLVPGEARLAQEQEYPNEDETHWNDDPQRSLHSPSDLAPFKSAADVILVGHAFAPRGEPARSVVARLVVGEIDKSVEVWGERAWTPDGQLREGSGFVKMPLRYERAAGGEGTANPVGIGPDARTDVYGNVAAPNLVPPGAALSSPKSFIPSACFGPIAGTWPTRRERLGRHASTWSSRWHLQPLPDGFDQAFFNAAPPDQQLAMLREDERLALENLHPEHPQLVTKLPGVRPRAFVERGAEPPQELLLRCDTLWIDTDRAIGTLTWRGLLAVESPAQAGRIVVAMETPGTRLSAAEVLRAAGGRALPTPPTSERTRVDPVVTMPRSGRSALEELSSAPPSAAPGGVPSAPPPLPRRAPRATHTMSAPPEANPLNALPFVPSADPLPARPSSPAIDTSRAGDATPPWLQARGWVPPVSSPRPSTAPPPPPPPGAAPMGSAPAAPIAPSIDSPWAGASRGSDIVPARAPQPPPPPPRTSSGGMAPMSSPSPLAPMPAPIAPLAPMSGAAPASGIGSSVAAASNAAAAASAWSLPTPPGPAEPAAAPAPRAVVRAARDVVDLIWHDPPFVPRVRERAAWKEILAELHPPPERKTGFDYDEEPEAPPPKDIEERKDVFAVLTRGWPTDAEGVNEAMAEAVADDGTFEPPLVLLSGELTFPFDELETLKATVTAVSPFVPGDKRLKDTIDMVNELLKTPWLQSSTGVAEGLTQKVREAFAQTSRMMPASHLDAHVDRILLEQRHYQRRTVFGETWIRSLLAMPGAQSALPTYLPEALIKKLPMFQSLRVRLLAEAHAQQDQYEAHTTALRVVALGRIIVPRRA